MRIKKVHSLLDKKNLDLLLIENPIDLFYLTGLEIEVGRLFIWSHGMRLFVDGRFYQQCKARFPTSKFSDHAIKEFIQKLKAKTLGFDAATATYAKFLTLRKLGVRLIPLMSPIKEIRAIKEKSEIALLRQAATLGFQGHLVAQESLKAGVTEDEVAFALESFWRQRGGVPAFSPIIAFGSNAAYPHHRASNRHLRKGEDVLIDIGVKLKAYNSDRTVTLLGKGSKLKKIYDIVRGAQEATFKLCKEGTVIDHLEKCAKEYIEKRGYELIHGIGHGLGLEVHEFPNLKVSSPHAKDPLRAGMVITIEPGIYVPRVGGVRLEESILITTSGFEILSL